MNVFWMCRNGGLVSQLDFEECLKSALAFGLPEFFNLEWILDRVEDDEWSGLWW